MERPWKRIRISDPEIRSPRDPGSQLAQGLFTSEMGMRSDETDTILALPTRTIDLRDLQRRGIAAPHLVRPPLQRRSAEHGLLPRADATVTANVIEINVGDGTAASIATTIPAASAETVVSIEDLPSLTVTAVSDVTNVVDSIRTDSQSVLTTPPSTPLPDDITSSTISESSVTSADSTFSSNGTITSSGRTVTVTATSTLDLAYLNGTFLTTSFSIRPTKSLNDATTDESSVPTDAPSGIGIDTDSRDYSSTTFYGAGNTVGPGSSTTSSGSAASSTLGSGGGGGGRGGGGGGGGGPGLSPEQQTVVGGVVGGIAGLAIVLLVLLAFLRWYRNRLKARGELPEQLAQRNLGLDAPGHHHMVSQRSSGVPLTSALAASLRKFRPISSHTQTTAHTASMIPESEKGFQRLAGRKIAPVLSTGGDGFGGNYGAFEKEVGQPGPATSHTRNERSLAGSSFYRDSNGFYGGRGDMPSSPTTATTATPRTAIGPASTARDFATAPNTSTGADRIDLLDDFPSSTSQISLPISRTEGMAALRPSPARTPVTISPATSSIGLPIQHNATSMQMSDDTPPVPNIHALQARDGIGRSLAREDDSRISRVSARSGTSTGRGSRFNENLL